MNGSEILAQNSGKESQMKREVGLWIDHNRSVVITLVGDKEETLEIRSNVEKFIRLTGGLKAKKTNLSEMSTSEDVGDRRYENHLNGYYNGLTAILQNADSIWIIGPGEAKGELKKSLEKGQLGDRIVGIVNAGKMTGPQISAKVRDHFHKYQNG